MNSVLFNGIKSIFSYRQLIWKLAINQIKAKFRYPILGIFWPIITPLFLSLIFLFAFSIVMKVNIPKYPFILYFLTGMFPWNYFASSINEATNSLIQNSQVIKSIYFNREIIPFSVILANLINFIFSLLVIAIFLLIFKIKLSIYVIFLPLVIILHTLFIFSISLITSSFQVILRDVRYIVELVLTALFFITPVFYPLDLVRDISPKLLKIYMLNPIASIITLYRIIILSNYYKSLPKEINYFILIFLPLIITAILIYIGFFIFKKIEPNLADFI